MKRKVLMITPYLPYPPASGGQVRSYNLLKYLSKNNQIFLVSLYKKKEDLKFLSELKKITYKVYPCKRAEKPWRFDLILKWFTSTKPYLAIRNFSEQAYQTIKKLLEKENFDLIHAETFYVMPLIPKTKIPIVLAEQTIEFLVYKKFVNDLPFFLRLFFYPEILKLTFWETYYWKSAKIVAPVSKEDEKIIKKYAPKTQTKIIPNGAGDEMFVKKLPKRDLENPVLLFVGNFLWLQNRDPALFLANNLAPILLDKLPKAKILIAGQHLKEKIKLKKIYPNVILKHLEESEKEQIKQLYKKATFFVAPITGPGGTRLKILAAMASGLPIIATKTAVSGLELKNKEHYFNAESPEDFYKAIHTLLKNKEFHFKIQKNAYELAKQKYSWKNIAKELEELYEKLKTKSNN